MQSHHHLQSSRAKQYRHQESTMRPYAGLLAALAAGEAFTPPAYCNRRFLEVTHADLVGRLVKEPALCGRVFGAWRVYAATRRVPLEPERAAGGGGGGGGALGAAGAAAALAEEALGVEEAVARIGRVLLEERARVMDLFTKWDTNKDGYVSKREFREAMAALQIPVKGEDVLALFAYFDPDESGAISFQELNRFFRSSRNSMAGSTAEAARAAEVRSAAALREVETSLVHADAARVARRIQMRRRAVRIAAAGVSVAGAVGGAVFFLLRNVSKGE